MVQRRQLRVLIAGLHDSFNHVLATNIRHLGYEATTINSASLNRSDSIIQKEHDILLYDLDNTFQQGEQKKNSPVSYQETGLAAVLQSKETVQHYARLTLLLSSSSVSRTMLEHIGAVAVLHKPFEMGNLQRYLQVLEQLLLPTNKPSTQVTETDPIEVLIVDDDRFVARTIAQYVQKHTGLTVAVAHDGLEALEQCITYQPRCVVTDLIMPWMNGYQVLYCLAQGDLSKMPAFIIISALTQHEKPIYRSYLAGKQVTYINKPFSMECLLDAIKQICAEEIK